MLTDETVRAHADAVARLRLLADLTRPADVAAAFVASLGSRRLEYRSALASYAVARVIPDHPLHVVPYARATICGFCGWTEGEEEATADLFRELRSRVGGVMHDRPSFVRFDLEWFRELEPMEPTADDWRRLELILRTPALLAPTAKPADLQRALRTAIRSNKDERTILIQILACAGILDEKDHPGYLDRFTTSTPSGLQHK